MGDGDSGPSLSTETVSAFGNPLWSAGNRPGGTSPSPPTLYLGLPETVGNVKEHINIKEARVCLMSLRRLSRTTRNLGVTALTLTGNLVSVLALEKGRSGSRSLNHICRRSAAYQLAGRIQWRLRHVESKRNNADAPSIWFGPDFPRPHLRASTIPSEECGLHTPSLTLGLSSFAPVPSSSRDSRTQDILDDGDSPELDVRA